MYWTPQRNGTQRNAKQNKWIRLRTPVRCCAHTFISRNSSLCRFFPDSFAVISQYFVCFVFLFYLVSFDETICYRFKLRKLKRNEHFQVFWIISLFVSYAYAPVVFLWHIPNFGDTTASIHTKHIHHFSNREHEKKNQNNFVCKRIEFIDSMHIIILHAQA